MSDINLSPPPQQIEEFDYIWKRWLYSLFKRVGSGPFMVRGYTVASVPPAASHSDNNTFSSLVYISDETGGATLAFSDGTNWRRVQDRTIIA